MDAIAGCAQYGPAMCRRRDMGLRAKFNLAVLAVFLLGFAGAWVFLDQRFRETARAEVLQNARIMLSAANAVRNYTARETGPLIAAAATTRFEPTTVPSYAAQTNFHAVQAENRDYSYKEAALNPTNPADRATDWEADFISNFRNRPELAELIGERPTPTGPALTLARPITITDRQCLTCHSTPDRAPAAMIQTYGQANGFGWQQNETVGAQLVSVPMALAINQARDNLHATMAILFGIFLGIMLILNLLLDLLVIRPVVRLSRIATAVSLGQPEVEDFSRGGHDEIARLAAAFTRMRRSLDNAMKMLGG
jgi:HAMP domain-containing protein